MKKYYQHKLPAWSVSGVSDISIEHFFWHVQLELLEVIPSYKNPQSFLRFRVSLTVFEIFQNFDFKGVNLNYYIHKRYATAQTLSLVGE